MWVFVSSFGIVTLKSWTSQTYPVDAHAIFVKR
jgi:hypothetical protein